MLIEDAFCPKRFSLASRVHEGINDIGREGMKRRPIPRIFCVVSFPPFQSLLVHIGHSFLERVGVPVGCRKKLLAPSDGKGCGSLMQPLVIAYVFASRV